MDINSVIAFGIVVVLAAGTGIYKIVKDKKAGKSITQEPIESILKGFTDFFTSTANDCIDVLDIANLKDVTEDEYKDLLAKKIVAVFNKDVTLNVGIADDEKINFVKNYILSIDSVSESIKGALNQVKASVNIGKVPDIAMPDTTKTALVTTVPQMLSTINSNVSTDKEDPLTEAVEVIDNSGVPTTDSTKTNMTDAINNYYTDGENN